jgi:hypothetical protein
MRPARMQVLSSNATGNFQLRCGVFVGRSAAAYSLEICLYLACRGAGKQREARVSTPDQCTLDHSKYSIDT